MTEGATDTSQQDFQDLKKKSLKGMSALFVRQVLVKIIFFAGNIVLARLLAPEIFGIYAIVSFVVTFFSTFGDVGIGAALIQKKGELSREELSTTFWLQQMLVWLVVGVVVLIAPLALKVYPSLPPVGVWLIRAMALSFLFSSLKTIPAILMERDIDFKRIAWVDITENLAYQGVVITCAFLGYGVWSFVAAAIARAFLGAVLIYAISSWRPSFHYRFESVKGLVRFGMPYQGNQILSFIKEAVTPLFVGAYAGAAAVGYVNLARNLAYAPLVLSDSFGRVAFPVFSKLQDDKELLTRTVERSIRIMTLVLLPVTAVMIALAPEIIHVVFTDKWMPGINAFYLFCISPVCVGIFLPLDSAILALGQSRILLIKIITLIIFEWGLSVPFVIYFGFTGVAMTQPIVTLLFTYVDCIILRKLKIRPRILINIIWQLVVAVIVCLVVKYLAKYFNVNLLSLIILSVINFGLYLILMYIVNKKSLFELKEYVAKIYH
jgi:O-antigen/teichoic acid export membrane protein